MLKSAGVEQENDFSHPCQLQSINSAFYEVPKFQNKKNIHLHAPQPISINNQLAIGKHGAQNYQIKRKCYNDKVQKQMKELESNIERHPEGSRKSERS